MAFYGKWNDYAACLKNAVKFLLVLVYKMNFLGVFLHAFTYANAGLQGCKIILCTHKT